MPWSGKADVARHHRRCAKYPKCTRLWTDTANRELKKSGDEGKAIRVANMVANRWLRKHEDVEAVISSVQQLMDGEELDSVIHTLLDAVNAYNYAVIKNVDRMKDDGYNCPLDKKGCKYHSKGICAHSNFCEGSDECPLKNKAHNAT